MLTTASACSLVLNDVHSRLNPTVVAQVVHPETIADLQAVILDARREGRAISVAGGCHAMGGQQFGEATLHVDTRPLDRVLAFDAERGLIEVEAGIQWAALIDTLHRLQPRRSKRWGIRQK